MNTRIGYPKRKTMEITIIETTEEDVTINCPHCGNWEALGIDDPRHHFRSLPVLDWIGIDEDGNELSRNGCSCGEEFIVTWDYKER